MHHTASGNSYRCYAGPLASSAVSTATTSRAWAGATSATTSSSTSAETSTRAARAAWRRPVLGAHTLGFNTNSMGIAVLGTYGTKPSRPPPRSNAIARLTAWKLGLYGANPKGKTYLKSGGGNRYARVRRYD